MFKKSTRSFITSGSKTNEHYCEKWEQNHLNVPDRLELMKELIMAGYEENQTIYFNKIEVYTSPERKRKNTRLGSHYKVDFVLYERRHIVEFSGKHHTTKFGVKRAIFRDQNLRKAGWFVTRIPYKEQDA